MLNHLTGKSPAHLKYILNNPQPATPAMALGSAIHMSVLEPEKFNDNYVVSPKFDRRTKQGKEDYKEFINNNLLKTTISETDFEIIEQITLKLMRDDLIKGLLQNGESEKIIAWNNPDYDIKCKGMLDYYRKNDGIIIDLKTTHDSSTRSFINSILKFKYHKQAAFYRDAVGADEFYIIAVEKSPPYSFNIFQISDGLLNEGRSLYNKDLEIYKYCLDNDYWPEYGYDFYNKDSERKIEIIDANIIK